MYPQIDGTYSGGEFSNASACLSFTDRASTDADLLREILEDDFDVAVIAAGTSHLLGPQEEPDSPIIVTIGDGPNATTVTILKAALSGTVILRDQTDWVDELQTSNSCNGLDP